MIVLYRESIIFLSSLEQTNPKMSMVLAIPMVITVVVLIFEPDFLLSIAFSLSLIMVWGQTDWFFTGNL